MKQLETLGFEADELPVHLAEVTPDQLARDAESTALRGLANYVTPFGINLAEEVKPIEVEYGDSAPTMATSTSTNANTGNNKGLWDHTADSDTDR